jgi:hypothetical protein
MPTRSHFSEEDYAPTFGGENFGGSGGPVNWLHPGEKAKHAGRGPRNYKRPDESILEEIHRELTYHPRIDATDIEVSVQDGEVTLTGRIEDRDMKRLAEDAADSVSGVRNVYNRIRIKASDEIDEESQAA